MTSSEMLLCLLWARKRHSRLHVQRFEAIAHAGIKDALILVMPRRELLPRLERVLEGGFERLSLVNGQEENGIPIIFTVHPIIVLTFSAVR